MPPEETTVQNQGSGSADAATGAADAATGATEGGTSPAQSTEDVAAWRNMVPKEFREDPALKDYKDFGGFVKSHVNLTKLLGREPRVPAQDAPPDVWNQFWGALGRPDAADKYTLPATPEGTETNPDFLKGMTSAFHEAGLTNSQAHKVVEAFYGLSNQFNDTLAAEVAANTERVERELRREWGQAYDNNVRLAHQFAKDYGGQELIDWLEASGEGSNPNLIRAFVKAARERTEDRFGSSRGSDFGYTPAEAAAEINRLNFDKDFQTALHDTQHPGHKAAVDRKRALFEAAYPTEEPA